MPTQVNRRSRGKVALKIVLTDLGGRPEGPLLVLGPSLGTSIDRLWGDAIRYLADFRLLGWDLPGHGHGPRHTAAFDLADLAAAVLASVDNSVPTGTGFCYAGDSIGGAVGLQLLLDRPDRVTAAAIVCSAAKIGEPQAWLDRAALVRAEGLGPIVANTPARWFGPRIVDRRPAAAQAALTDLAGVEPESYARLCEALSSFDLRQRLVEVTAPVLVIGGECDQVIPVASLAEVAGGVAHGRLEMLPGVAHLAPLEDPMSTAALLVQHFSLPSRDSPAHERLRRD